jgi:hypothetical protein
MTKQEQKIEELFNKHKHKIMMGANTYICISEPFFTIAFNELADWVRGECTKAYKNYVIPSSGDTAFFEIDCYNNILNAGK